MRITVMMNHVFISFSRLYVYMIFHRFTSIYRFGLNYTYYKESSVYRYSIDPHHKWRAPKFECQSMLINPLFRIRVVKSETKDVKYRVSQA